MRCCRCLGEAGQRRVAGPEFYARSGKSKNDLFRRLVSACPSSPAEFYISGRCISGNALPK